MNYHFFSEELRDLEMKGVEKKVQKKLKEAKDLQKDLEDNKKLKKTVPNRQRLDQGYISLQTVLSEMRRGPSSGRSTPLDARDSSAWCRTVTWIRAISVHVQIQGHRREAVLLDEVRHRDQAHQNLDGERRLQGATDRFSRSGNGLRDTFPACASILQGDEIHHGSHAEVDTYRREEKGRYDETDLLQLQPPECGDSQDFRHDSGRERDLIGSPVNLKGTVGVFRVAEHLNCQIIDFPKPSAEASVKVRMYVSNLGLTLDQRMVNQHLFETTPVCYINCLLSSIRVVANLQLLTVRLEEHIDLQQTI